MNWYGGSLKRNKDPTKTKGKRIRRLNGRATAISNEPWSPTTFRPSFFPQPEILKYRQKKLDEYPNVAPAIKRLDAMKKGTPERIDLTLEVSTHEADSDQELKVITRPEQFDHNDQFIQASNDQELFSKKLQLLNQIDWAGLYHKKPIDYSKARKVRESQTYQRPTLKPLVKRQKISSQRWEKQPLAHFDGPINIKHGTEALESTVASPPSSPILFVAETEELPFDEGKSKIEHNPPNHQAVNTGYPINSEHLPTSQMPVIRSELLLSQMDQSPKKSQFTKTIGQLSTDEPDSVQLFFDEFKYTTETKPYIQHDRGDEISKVASCIPSNSNLFTKISANEDKSPAEPSLGLIDSAYSHVTIHGSNASASIKFDRYDANVSLTRSPSVHSHFPAPQSSLLLQLSNDLHEVDELPTLGAVDIDETAANVAQRSLANASSLETADGSHASNSLNSLNSLAVAASATRLPYVVSNPTAATRVPVAGSSPKGCASAIGGSSRCLQVQDVLCTPSDLQELEALCETGQDFGGPSRHDEDENVNRRKLSDIQVYDGYDDREDNMAWARFVFAPF